MTTASFEFATAGRIMAGTGRAAELPGVLAGLGPPAAVFTVPGEPTAELARAGVAAAREHGADVIAAISGGSVIDTAKAVAMLLANGLRPGSPVLDRYAEAAGLLTGLHRQPGASAEDGVAWIRQTLTLLAVPGLAAFGLTAGQAGGIAAQALTSSSMQGNPVPLTQDELEAIVRQAL